VRLHDDGGHEEGFLAQKKRITAKFAQEDLLCNN